LKIGIIGLPLTGKTTIFNALTGSDEMTANFASQSTEHHVGVVEVPDPRFETLVNMYEPKKQVPATIEFVDVAGISKGAGKQGLSTEMVQFIRDVDALLHVVRSFENESVPHTEGSIDPARDIETIDTELILNDLMFVEKRLEKLEKDLLRLPKDKRPQLEHEKKALLRFQTQLEAEKPLRSLDLDADEAKWCRQYALLSVQPMMILLNVGEDQLTAIDDLAQQYTPNAETPTMAICGKVEAEIAQLDDDDKALFMTEMGITEPGLNRVIRASYDLLGLHCFFTVGKDEVRAWTIRKGDNAVTAAGKIHSDLARGFIRAETVAYEDLIQAGSWAKTKEVGTFRLEGKEYIVQDGDILSIRFNV